MKLTSIFVGNIAGTIAENVLVCAALLVLCGCGRSNREREWQRRQARMERYAERHERMAEEHDRDDDDEDNGKETRVKMEKSGGVYLVPVTVNGLNLKFIFDTGASNISISDAEAAVMAKQGLITEEDVVGQGQFQDATGNVSEGTVIRLRSVIIGGKELHNVEASVVHNMDAPLLFGQSALSKFGKVSIDYEDGYIEFD